MPEIEALPVDWFQTLPRATGFPRAHGSVRVSAEDFQVREELGFTPEGKGCHVLLLIQKCQYNTMEVARMLSSFARIPSAGVGFCGLKDRNAVTQQWFSVDLGNQSEPNWGDLNGDRIRVLEIMRHRRKLKRGSHRSNHFVLIIRSLDGDLDWLEHRFAEIQLRGVPNYFGEQRFGKDDSNLAAVRAMFTGASQVRGRQQRGLYLSAARSFLFNQILSARVRDGSWNRLLPGEAVVLDGSSSYFRCIRVEEEFNERLDKFDIHPSGALWGEGDHPVRDLALQVERAAITGYPSLREGLERAGVQHARRALRARVGDLSWEFNRDNSLRLTMRLGRGVYATSVLRECIT